MTSAPREIERRRNGPKQVNLSTIVLVIFIPLFAFLYATNFSDTNKARVTCEIANDGRQQFAGLLRDLVDVNQQRIDLVSPGDPSIPGNRNARNSYARRLKSLKASVVDPDPNHPIRRDCEAAYPYPWPFG